MLMDRSQRPEVGRRKCPEILTPTPYRISRLFYDVPRVDKARIFLGQNYTAGGAVLEGVTQAQSPLAARQRWLLLDSNMADTAHTTRCPHLLAVLSAHS
jgi:hypothetical protein